MKRSKILTVVMALLVGVALATPASSQEAEPLRVVGWVKFFIGPSANTRPGVRVAIEPDWTVAANGNDVCGTTADHWYLERKSTRLTSDSVNYQSKYDALKMAFETHWRL